MVNRSGRGVRCAARIALIFGLFAPCGVLARAGVPVPPTRRAVSVVMVPTWLSVGFLRIDTELRVSARIGLKVVLGAFTDFELRDYVLGGQVNWYLFGDFDRGAQLGIEYSAGRKRRDALIDRFPPTFVATAGARTMQATLVGPHIGYKYIARGGLTIEAQLGVQAVFVRFDDAAGAPDPPVSAMPVVATNFGWSF